MITILFCIGNGFGQANPIEILQTNIVTVQIPSTLAVTNTLSIKPEKESLELLRQAVRDHTAKDVFLLIFGAIIAGLIGYFSSLRIHRLEIKQREKEELAFRNNILRAIRSELESLKIIYEKGIGAKLKESEKLDFFPVRLSLTQEWFTVFNANAVHIVKIEKEISNQIITTYALNKALIEAFRINNDYLAEMARIGFEIQQRGAQADLNLRFETVQGWLVTHKAEIKKSDKALQAAVKNLFEALDKRGVS
jgi:hypothetical protein